MLEEDIKDENLRYGLFFFSISKNDAKRIGNIVSVSLSVSSSVIVSLSCAALFSDTLRQDENVCSP